MRKYLFIIDTVNEWTGKFAHYIVLLMIGALLIEVIARYVFNCPTFWAHETTRLLLGSYMYLLAGYCLLHGVHVRVDVLWRMLSRRHRAIIDLCTSVMFFVLMVLLLWKVGVKTWDSVMVLELSPSVWRPPVWPFKIIAVVGMVLLFAQGIAKFIRDLYIVRGWGD